MAWDSNRNQFVGLTANVLGAQLYAVDVTNGATTLLADTPGIDNNGLTYDPVIDRFWAAVYNPEDIHQFDPNSGYERSTVATNVGRHTCIAYVP